MRSCSPGPPVFRTQGTTGQPLRPPFITMAIVEGRARRDELQAAVPPLEGGTWNVNITKTTSKWGHQRPLVPRLVSLCGLWEVVLRSDGRYSEAIGKRVPHGGSSGHCRTRVWQFGSSLRCTHQEEEEFVSEPKDLSANPQVRLGIGKRRTEIEQLKVFSLVSSERLYDWDTGRCTAVGENT